MMNANMLLVVLFLLCCSSCMVSVSVGSKLFAPRQQLRHGDGHGHHATDDMALQPESENHHHMLVESNARSMSHAEQLPSGIPAKCFKNHCYEEHVSTEPTLDPNLDSIRLAAIMHARSMIGQTCNTAPDPTPAPRGKTQPNYGGPLLVSVFKDAGYGLAPGSYAETLALKVTGSSPAWCGIFDTAMHRRAGNSRYAWKLGSNGGFIAKDGSQAPQIIIGKSDLASLGAKPGDVVIGTTRSDPGPCLWHHMMIEAINGDEITVLEGNAGWCSAIRRRVLKVRREQTYVFNTKTKQCDLLAMGWSPGVLVSMEP